MARVINNSLLKALRGSIGKEVVFKQYKDKTVVSKYPEMSKVKASKRQKSQREKMRAANNYASMVLSDLKLRSKYEKKLKRGESLFHRAKKDFFERMKRNYEDA